MGTFFFDDKVEHFGTDDYHLYDPTKITKPRILIGGDRYNPDKSFFGAVSCVQVFNEYLNEAAIHFKKDCSATDISKYQSGQCPQDYSFFDGYCYKVSLSKVKYSDAEIGCLPSKHSKYRSQLVYTENRIVLDFLASFVNASHGTPNFWIGLERQRQSLEWETR